jgi:hypothetical protein
MTLSNIRSITSMDPSDVNYDWNDSKKEVTVTCDKYPDLALQLFYKTNHQTVIKLTPEAKLILDRATSEKQELMNEQLTLLKSFALGEVEKHQAKLPSASQGDIKVSVDANKKRIKVICKGQFKEQKGELTLRKFPHKPAQIATKLSKKSELYSLLNKAAEQSLATAKNKLGSKHHHK